MLFGQEEEGLDRRCTLDEPVSECLDGRASWEHGPDRTIMRDLRSVLQKLMLLGRLDVGALRPLVCHDASQCGGQRCDRLQAFFHTLSARLLTQIFQRRTGE